MCGNYLRCFAAAAALSLAGTAFAADEVELPEVEVVGSELGAGGAEEDKYLSPGTVSVVRAEELEGEQRTVPELLEAVPGLRVIRSRGRHGYTVASVRGSTSAQVAVYVDGVLMNLGSEAAVDLSAIPADNVERIEVYRGYVPARFGAQAMGGVINIITKRGVDSKFAASLGAGSFGRFKGNISYGGELGRGNIFAAFGYETYDGNFKYFNDNGTPYNLDDDYTGKRADNGFKNMDLLVKWQDDHWRAKASWVRNDRDLALAAPGNDNPARPNRPGALLDTDRFDLLVGRSQTAGSVNWDWELKYTQQNKDYDSRRGENLSPIGGSNVTKSSYDTKRWDAQISASWAMGERHFLEALAVYTDERLDVGGDTLFEYLGGISKYTSRSWGATLQDTIALDKGGTFLFTPSLRWHSDDDDEKLTWQLALTKEFSRSWMLKTSYGTYSRAPNLYEKYGDGAFILPAANTMKWETGRQFDIGLIWTGGNEKMRANASVSYFNRKSDNLIEFVMTSPRYGRYANIAEAKVQGVELEAGFDWKRWALSLSGTWLDGENLTPDEEGSVRQHGMTLPNRPEWFATARLTHKFRRGSVFAEYQYVGKNYADTSEHVLFSSRSLWNIGIKYELSPTSELIVGVNDLFDSADDLRMKPDGIGGPTRILWYPLEGRSYYATLMMKF